MRNSNVNATATLNGTKPRTVHARHRLGGLPHPLDEWRAIANKRDETIEIVIAPHSTDITAHRKNVGIELDEALVHKILSDQIKAYMTTKAKGEHFLEYKLVPEAEKVMPKKELFPLMREQLVTFED